MTSESGAVDDEGEDEGALPSLDDPVLFQVPSCDEQQNHIQ